MAVVSIHYQQTYIALQSLGFSEKLANDIGIFASIGADNPLRIALVYDGFNNDIKLSFDCARPLTKETTRNPITQTTKTSFNCKQEDKRNYNLKGTADSQKDNPENVIRHSMLSTLELNSSRNKINLKYLYKLKQFVGILKIVKIDINNVTSDDMKYLRSIINRRLQSYEFIELNTFEEYNKEITQDEKRLEAIAKRNGMWFGWTKIFEAAELSRTVLPYTSWTPVINDATKDGSLTDNSGIAKLGQGIHALQDAVIHQGESMEHFGENMIEHIEKDSVITPELTKISRLAGVVFLLISDNLKILKKESIDELKNNLDFLTLQSDKREKIQTIINQYYGVESYGKAWV